MTEDALLTGRLEETNEGYAVAKIAAPELAKMYRRQYGMDAISLMPTNLHGPHVRENRRKALIARRTNSSATRPVLAAFRELRRSHWGSRRLQLLLRRIPGWRKSSSPHGFSQADGFACTRCRHIRRCRAKD